MSARALCPSVEDRAVGHGAEPLDLRSRRRARRAPPTTRAPGADAHAPASSKSSRGAPRVARLAVEVALGRAQAPELQQLEHGDDPDEQRARR